MSEELLTIPLDVVCHIVSLARAFDEKVAASGMKGHRGDADDDESSILEDLAGDPTEEELRAAIDNLNIDEEIDLVALMWLGREDFDDFMEAREQVEDSIRRRTADYLMGTPLLSDHLENGLDAMGLSCDDID